MLSPLVLGRVRFGEVLGAAALMTLSSVLAFLVFAFLVLPSGSWSFVLPDLALALAAFLATVPLRRRGAALSSALVGVAAAATFELVLLWLSASQNIRALGRPDPFALLILVAAASVGVLAAFRVVPPAPPARRWNRMAMW